MFTVSPSGHFFLVFLANNVAQEKFLKEKNKIRAASMRIIFRMHRLQAHTWHSALLRKQHCCLPSPSGTERDTPSVIFMLLSLSICLKSRTDSLLPSHSGSSFLHQRFLQCLRCDSLKSDFQSLLASEFITFVLLVATPATQCQLLRHLAGGFGGQQSESPIKISWFE